MGVTQFGGWVGEYRVSGHTRQVDEWVGLGDGVILDEW